MGIKGLWNLLKPVGQPIDLESLRGKTLAVDISFWLHHAKYVSELRGISEQRAAIELVYRRVVKLLHFGIKPVFVFDGPESSIFKLPTLRERRRQREHQVDEKAKRGQNRALKTLARKALAVQLARDEGQRRKKEVELDSSTSSLDDSESEALDAGSAPSSQDIITLSDDGISVQDADDDDDDLSMALFLSQLDHNSGDVQQPSSVDIVLSGSQHAHVLIRSDSNSQCRTNGGFCDGRERKREALERVRRLAAHEHVRSFRQHPNRRQHLVPSRLLAYEDERHILSSDDDFEEVPDAPTISFCQPQRPALHREDKETAELPSTSTVHQQQDEPKRISIERWDAKPNGSVASKESSSSGEISQRCRELLTYFGVPVVDSPAEAEAHCAYLDFKGLTDGTITDDSDAWAFGARTVYRHVFDRKKSALQYRAKDNLEIFGLDRLHFVALALILGCDFTPGIVNVGAVSALELISTFIKSHNGDSNEGQFLEGLTKFRRWWEKHHTEEGKPDAPEKNAVKRRLRKLNCVFPSSFPDPRVFRLFTEPKVKEIVPSLNGEAAFEWTRPDLGNLRRLLTQELGSDARVDVELVLLQRRTAASDPSQAKITGYCSVVKKRLSSSEGFEASCSKRVRKACEKLRKAK